MCRSNSEYFNLPGDLNVESSFRSIETKWSNWKIVCSWTVRVKGIRKRIVFSRFVFEKYLKFAVFPGDQTDRRIHGSSWLHYVRTVGESGRATGQIVDIYGAEWPVQSSSELNVEIQSGGKKLPTKIVRAMRKAKN